MEEPLDGPVTHDNKNAEKLIIEWSDTLKTGYEVIDIDHKAILETYNKVCRSGHTNISNKAFTNNLQEFAFKVSMHCLEEENIMISIKYPGFERHALAHIEINDNINNLISNMRNGTTTLDAVYEIIIEWLTNHIYDHDRELVDFIRDSSTQAPSIHRRRRADKAISAAQPTPKDQ